MTKYCDYYFTTKLIYKTKRFAWYIRNSEGEELQSSYETSDDPIFQEYDSKIAAELAAREAIQDYYV